MSRPTCDQHRMSLLLIAVVALWFAPTLYGQDTSPNEPDANTVTAESEPDDKADSILAMIVDSGVTGVAFMALLGLFSLVAGTVAVERAVNMSRRRMLPDEFLDELQRFARRPANAAEKIAELCSTSTAPIATILLAGLQRQGRTLIEVEKAMEDAAAREMAETQAKIRPLRTVGSVAPLVGLLGTVVGMIIAFHTASQAGLGKAELLAKGIYMALLTTAGGLSVAIPSLMLGSFFGGRLEAFFRETDRHVMPLVPLFAQTPPTANPNESVMEKKPEGKPLVTA